jgi:hypothetical protein
MLLARAPQNQRGGNRRFGVVPQRADGGLAVVTQQSDRLGEELTHDPNLNRECEDWCQFLDFWKNLEEIPCQVCSLALETIPSSSIK